MSNIITVKKKDFLARFKTGFDIVYNQQTPDNFNPKRTTIVEVFLDVTNESLEYNGYGLVDRKLIDFINPERYVESISEIKKKADELYISSLDFKINKLEHLLSDFPKYKAFLYSRNVGNPEKIALSNSHYKNLEVAKKMASGIAPLPEKIIYLIPEQFNVPSFIPELGQSFYRGYFDDYHDFGVEEFKVCKIAFFDGFYPNLSEEMTAIDKSALLNKSYSDKALNVVVEMQSLKDETIIRLQTKELSMFENGSFQQGTFHGIFESKEKAVTFVKERALMAMSMIEDNLMNL